MGSQDNSRGNGRQAALHTRADALEAIRLHARRGRTARHLLPRAWLAATHDRARVCQTPQRERQRPLCLRPVHGGRQHWRTMDLLRHDLEARGVELNAAFSLIMPESYLGLPFFNVDNAKKEKEKKEKAAAELKGYIQEIANRKPASHLVRGRWPRINSRLLGGFFTKYLVSDKKFKVDTDRCIKCGICASVCPTKNVIGGKDAEPQWKHDGSCLACFACYHHCPRHAIDYGSLTKRKGQYFFGRKNG